MKDEKIEKSQNDYQKKRDPADQWHDDTTETPIQNFLDEKLKKIICKV
jgi:hypothetical protein